MLLRIRALVLHSRPATRLVRRVLEMLPLKGRILSGPGRGLRFDARGRKAGYLLGTTAPEEQDLLMRSLQPGNVFWDVGANIGYYAVIAARRVGAHGEVVAFEPVEDAAARIEWNANANSMTNIEVVRAACGAERGVLLGIVNGVQGTNGKQGDDAVAGCELPLIKLDDFAIGRRPPDVIMIDVEGHEVKVLQGAMSLLSQTHPTILVEVHGGEDTFSSYVVQHLAPLGYAATTYSGGPIPRSTKHRYHAVLRWSALN